MLKDLGIVRVVNTNLNPTLCWIYLCLCISTLLHMQHTLTSSFNSLKSGMSQTLSSSKHRVLHQKGPTQLQHIRGKGCPPCGSAPRTEECPSHAMNIKGTETVSGSCCSRRKMTVLRSLEWAGMVSRNLQVKEYTKTTRKYEDKKRTISYQIPRKTTDLK